MKAKFIFFFLVHFMAIFCCNSFAQQAISRKSRDGWAVQLGAGYLYGGNIGVLGEFQFRLIDKLRITPFLSTGIAEGGTDNHSNRYGWLGISSGANIEFGRGHRLISGVNTGLQQVVGKADDVEKNHLESIAVIIGYKGVADFGLIWMFYIGDIYVQDPSVESKDFSHYSQVGLGLGYKF